jgi:hypothetical protein
MNATQKFTMFALTFALIIAAGTSIYYYNAYHAAGSGGTAQANNAANQASVIATVAKVGQLMVLPSNESPTVATVVDPSLLSSQPFFANAKKGDVVLIYTSAKMAVLYDPTMNKIVNVAPITIGSPTTVPAPQVQTSTPTSTPSAKK